MGGYAAFIWPSYGIVALVLGVMLVSSIAGMRARERELTALEERMGPRRQRRRQEDRKDARHDA